MQLQSSPDSILALFREGSVSWAGARRQNFLALAGLCSSARAPS